MRISLPLAGMDPSRRAGETDRDEDRGFRMLSEGELFYVDTDVHEDINSTNRHDHGHLGGVSLEIITQSMATRKPGQILKPESIADTEAASRSSSQDSSSSGETPTTSWEARGTADQTTPTAAITAAAVEAAHQASSSGGTELPSGTRISLEEARQWDYSNLEDYGFDTRPRERSFSEAHLRRMHHDDHINPTRHDSDTNSNRFSQNGQRGQGRGSLAAVAAFAQRRSVQHDNNTVYDTGIEGLGMCERAAWTLERTWGCLFGGGENKSTADRNTHGKSHDRPRCFRRSSTVEHIARHLSSCTSTKTFEVSSSDNDRNALARLGVVPDTDRGYIGADSMTFTMHIAGQRVVSTILGRHAEYEVRVKGGGRRWSRWQRFSKFKQIAACVDNDPPAMKAWARVVRAQPRYRCLNPEYLAQKCNLLEVFLQQVMFAMPTPALLIHFVSHD